MNPNKQESYPEPFDKDDLEPTPGPMDATTGTEGGGPRVGFGPNPTLEQSSGRPTSGVSRNQASGSSDQSLHRDSLLRMIPTSVHGAMDYFLGALLIAAPWLFEFNFGGAETWTPVIIGGGIIFYSLMTAYELGVIPIIRMPAHLALDVIGGAVLATSPWLFDFADVVWIPHLAVGLVEIGTALMTRTTPSYIPYAGGTRPSRT